MHQEKRLLRYSTPFAALTLLACSAFADARTRAECDATYTPERAQSGKDVIWIPTDDALVERMLMAAKVGPNDLVYDLGAGDGRIPIMAAKKFGAKAIGIEYNPDFAKYAQCLVEAEAVTERAQVVQGDIFETDFSSATVVTLYLLPELNLRLRPTILKMKPGTRVVSHSFSMADWEPDETIDVDAGRAFLWIVPAQAGGDWRFKEESGPGIFDINLDQAYQKIAGTELRSRSMLAGATLKGKDIAFEFGTDKAKTEVAGEVDGDRIVARATRDGKTARYIGTRIN